jgi:uncharacterized protein (DUF2062 family)
MGDSEKADGVKRPFFRRRLADPMIVLLRQGVTPEKLALSLTLGILLGVFPVLGSTTILCAAAALILRLNLPAIQLVNYFVYPLQLALLIPFMRIGEKIFRAQPMALSLAQLIAKVHANMWQSIQELWVTTVHAMVVWVAVSIPAAALLYFILALLLRSAWRAQHAVSGASAIPPAAKPAAARNAQP